MLSVEKLKQRPRHFERFTGLSVAQFESLALALAPVYARRERARLERPERCRARGAGRDFKLSSQDRLLATLLYLRLYVTGALLSYLFNLDESNLSRERTQRMLPALQEVLPTPMQDHLLSALEPSGATSAGQDSTSSQFQKRGKRIGTLEDLLRAHPELADLCIDATEQEVPKPQSKRRQKQFYSGKSHCHTIKTQLTTSRRLILHTLGGCPGSLADSTMLKASGVLPAIARASAPVASAPVASAPVASAPVASAPATQERRVRLDRGYSGIEKSYAGATQGAEGPDWPGVQLLVALKGNAHTKVTLLGKLWNRIMVARQRIQVEQNIGHLKNWRLLSGLYRGTTGAYQACFQAVAGLHNFRILGALTW